MAYLFDIQPDNQWARELSDNDPLLGKLIHRIGPIRIPARQDGFAHLVQSLIGQQLSIKAAETIFRRVEQVCGAITPASVLAAEEDLMRSAGLSRNKLGYIRNVAAGAEAGLLDFQSFNDMDDEEVVRILTSIKGIGRWTAEMFLIFYLGRQDVLSFGDNGLNRAAAWLYAAADGGGSQPPLQRKQAEWTPYCTFVSLYLWEAVNLGLPKGEPL